MRQYGDERKRETEEEKKEKGGGPVWRWQRGGEKWETSVGEMGKWGKNGSFDRVCDDA